MPILNDFFLLVAVQTPFVPGSIKIFLQCCCRSFSFRLPKPCVKFHYFFFRIFFYLTFFVVVIMPGDGLLVCSGKQRTDGEINERKVGVGFCHFSDSLVLLPVEWSISWFYTRSRVTRFQTTIVQSVVAFYFVSHDKQLFFGFCFILF